MSLYRSAASGLKAHFLAPVFATRPFKVPVKEKGHGAAAVADPVLCVCLQTRGGGAPGKMDQTAIES